MTTKYGNKKTECDGHIFDSAAEARRYRELRLLERANVIEGLKLQPEFILQPAYKRNGKRIQAIKYRGDFLYIEDGVLVVEDVKGVETPVFRLKRKMFEYVYPEIQLKVVAA